MAIDTKTLYNFVQFVANKEQAGFVTTDEFEQAANSAQLELIRDRIGNPNSTQPGRPVGMGGYGTSQFVTDDLRQLIVNHKYTANTQAQESGGSATQSAFSKVSLSGLSDSFLYLLNVTRPGSSTLSDGFVRSVKIVDIQELYYLLESEILQPTIDYPYGTIYDDSLFVYPYDANNHPIIQYIKIPTKGTLTESIDGTTGAITVATNVSFTDLPESLFNEMAWRTLSLFGLNLRDAQITQYAEAQEKEIM